MGDRPSGSTQLNELEEQVFFYLDNIRAMKQEHGLGKYVYYGMEDFILQHGVWYRPNGKIPNEQGAPKSCFGNALVVAAQDKGFRYIEGMALAPTLPIPIHHAWNLTPDGELYDSTWMNTGLAYIGVEFSVGRADNATWFDNATVLDNPRNRSIYMRRWEGEKYSLTWRTSKVLRTYRRLKKR